MSALLKMPTRPGPALCRGITLIELMIAMVLGLVVVLGVIGVVSNNSQNYRISEGLAELQENARTGFELLARDIRAARDTGCGPIDVDTTPLYASPSAWWHTWQPVIGFEGDEDSPAVSFGSAAGERVADTHALQLQGTNDGWPLRNTNPTATTVTTVSGHNLQTNNIVVLCDLENQGAMLHRVTGGGGNSVNITPQTTYFTGQIAQYWATTWFIGNNGRPDEGGRSLYRMRYDQASQSVVTEEMLPGITDMQLRYRIDGSADFDTTVTAAQWINVTAIEITLTSETTSRNVTTEAGADVAVGADDRLLRTSTNVISLRNRP
ncbi:MAG: PilW family protein [Rhodocyclaceae bacterium]